MMRLIIAIVSYILLFISCEKQDKNDNNNLEYEVISKLVTENDKTYLEVNKAPFPLFGAQIRLDAFLNCENKSIEQIEIYFAKAKELGVNCLQIPIWWKNIEPSENRYSFAVVDKILEYANKYDLKIEILWFSTNMCGDSFTYLVPTYIMSVPEKRLARNDEGSFWNYYGYQYSLILNDQWILERETKVLKELLNHIAKWDNENDKKHPVITIQIHNEPDAFSRWRYDQKDIHYRDERSFTKQDAWHMTLNALDILGKAVKETSYIIVTRCNIITSNGLNNFPEVTGANPIDVYELEGIDLLAYDPYVSSINTIKNNTLAFRSIDGNYPLIAENKGVYENSASLILVAAALGSGYNIYDLATSKFFIDNTSPDMVNQIDHGVYTWDLKEKSHTPKVRAILKGLVAAYPDVARTGYKDFIAFNVRSQLPETICSQQINSTKVKFSFSTSQGALGFAITTSNHILIYSTEEAEFKFYNGTFLNVITGSYDQNGEFIANEENISLTDGYILNAEKEVLYKIDYYSDGDLESTSLVNIGY